MVGYPFSILPSQVDCYLAVMVAHRILLLDSGMDMDWTFIVSFVHLFHPSIFISSICIQPETGLDVWQTPDLQSTQIQPGEKYPAQTFSICQNAWCEEGWWKLRRTKFSAKNQNFIIDFRHNLRQVWVSHTPFHEGSAQKWPKWKMAEDGPKMTKKNA